MWGSRIEDLSSELLNEIRGTIFPQEDTAEFIAKYDSPAFDDSKPALSLDLFAPVLRKVMTEPRNSLYKEALDRSQ